MDDKYYPKFQLSWFTQNGTQVVVRGNELNEWNTDVSQAKLKYAPGQKPQPSQSNGNGGFQKKPVEYADYECPTCSSKVKKGVSKKGMAFESCTNKTYNKDTGKYEGCEYFKYI